MVQLRELYGEKVAAVLEASGDSSGLVVARTRADNAQRVMEQSRGQMKIAGVDHENAVVTLIGTPDAAALRAMEADDKATVTGASHLMKLSPAVIDMLHAIAENGKSHKQADVPDALRVALNRDYDPVTATELKMPWQLPAIDAHALQTSATYFGDHAMGAVLQRAVNDAQDTHSASTSRCNFAKLQTKASSSGEYARVSGIHKVAKKDRHVAHCFAALVSVLSLSTDIRSVDVVSEAFILNNFASAAVQSGLRDVFPLWKRGLNGTDQIVAVGRCFEGMQSSRNRHRWLTCYSCFIELRRGQWIGSFSLLV